MCVCVCVRSKKGLFRKFRLLFITQHDTHQNARPQFPSDRRYPAPIHYDYYCYYYAYAFIWFTLTIYFIIQMAKTIRTQTRTHVGLLKQPAAIASNHNYHKSVCHWMSKNKMEKWRTTKAAARAREGDELEEEKSFWTMKKANARSHIRTHIYKSLPICVFVRVQSWQTWKTVFAFSECDMYMLPQPMLLLLLLSLPVSYSVACSTIMHAHLVEVSAQEIPLWQSKKKHKQQRKKHELLFIFSSIFAWQICWFLCEFCCCSYVRIIQLAIGTHTHWATFILAYKKDYFMHTCKQ